MNIKNKKYLFVIVCFLLILFSIFSRIVLLNTDYSAEETDFIKPAESILFTGKTDFYHSEQLPSIKALYHPPMYLHLLALVFLYSHNEISARSINFSFSLLTALLIFLFCKNLIRKDGKIIGLISSLFFLINYYVLSSSIQIDIDMLSTFFVFSFVFSIVLFYKSQKVNVFIISIISLFFALWNRYPIAILVYLCLGVYIYLKNKKIIKKYLMIGGISLGLFILTWGIYSLIIDPGNFFSFISHNIAMGTDSISNFKVYILSFVLNIIQLIRLNTIPGAILILFSWFYFSKNNDFKIKMLWLYTLIIFFFFMALPRPAFGYPRYFLSMLPGVSILVGLLVYEQIFKKDYKNNSLLWIGFTSFFISLFILIGLNVMPTIYASDGLIKATNLPDFTYNLLASLPLIFLFLNKKQKKLTFFVILIALFLVYSLYFDLNLLNHQSHIKETGEYLKSHTYLDEIIIAPKAVGYYAERKFYVNDNNKPLVDNLSLDYIYFYIYKSAENRKMNDEFFWSKGFYGGFYSPQPPKESLEKAKYIVLYHPVEGYVPEKIIGEFYIYRMDNSSGGN